MRSYNFVVERDPETNLLVGYVPGWPGAHSQGADIDELQRNLREVIEMLLEDGEPALESEFVLGSGQLATELDRLDLIDEYKLLVHPRIAGHGPTLYESGLPARDGSS